MTEAPIRILMVEDHLIARFGVKGLLQDEPDLRVVGEAKDGTEVLTKFAEHQPDVVLMDLRMPGMGGIEATAQLKKQHPAARVLILSSYDADEDIRQALEAGALGYVMKEADGEELCEAIRQVAAGEKYLSARIAARLQVTQGDARLRQRERDILQLMSKGLSNREIAGLVNLTPGTVRIYVSNIFEKLGASNRAEAVATALSRGLLRND